MTTSNEWCQVLGIEPPSLEAAAGQRDANSYALLLVALLERGRPMTLFEVAARFEEAGIAQRARALLSLQRCKPARPPLYREGDHYHLDPHDTELDLWAFRLGLRPPKVAPVEKPPVELPPAPDLSIRLGPGELEAAWRDASLYNWSRQRLVLAVLDSRGGPCEPGEVVALVASYTKYHGLNADTAKFRRQGSSISVLGDGRWAIAAGADEALRQARAAVRERVALVRRNAAARQTPEAIAATRADWERRRAENGALLAGLSRALLVTFPLDTPRAAALLLDVGEHEITTFTDDDFSDLRQRLGAYDILGGINIRARLRALNVAPDGQRLAELGPPQKTKKLNRQGRTLKITTALLVQSSCGISKPFGEEARLADYVAKGDLTKLLRRLEADVKSLYALYEYGRLHGTVRLRWGFLEECIPAPWVHRDEPLLHDLERQALMLGAPLEVVVGSAPGWEKPWARARYAHVEPGENGWQHWLVDDAGSIIDQLDVQRARLLATVH
jgi:hypothetical protein